MRPGNRGALQPVLVLGCRGTLGVAFCNILGTRGLPSVALSHQDLDIADPGDVDQTIASLRPWLVVNAGGYVRVDQAEADADACFRVNSEGPAVLARACDRYGARFLTFSSDLVFDGSKGSPYFESDATAPLNVYGRSKAEAEKQVLEAQDAALVVRTSAFFGPWDSAHFLHHCAERLRQGLTFDALDDVYVSPTYVPDLVNAALDLVLDGENGIWHLANEGETTWSAFAQDYAHRAGLDAQLIVGQSWRSLSLPAPRPRYSVLGSERAWIMPTLEDALDRFVRSSPERVEADQV